MYCVAGQGAGSDAKHDPAMSHVVKLTIRLATINGWW